MAEEIATTKSPGRRAAFQERMKKKHPDKQFVDDEELFGAIDDDYNDYDDRISQYEDSESKLSSMFGKDPRSARFFSEWAKGGDPAILLVRMFGDDIKEASDNPEKLEQIEQAQKEYIERVQKDQQLEDEYKENLKESLSKLEKAQQEHGYSDDDIDKGMAWLQQIVQDAIVGKFAPETLEMALKAINYDNDMSEAGREGEVRGRNTRIEEKLRKPSQGDGTRQLNGKNGKVNGAAQKVPSLGALDRFGEDDSNDIFARGGEKRTSYR